jgi:hypothetical protein
MEAVPAAMALTLPVELTVATDMLSLVHEPPVVVLVSVVAAPVQALNVPVIAAGLGLTVITVVVYAPDT